MKLTYLEQLHVKIEIKKLTEIKEGYIPLSKEQYDRLLYLHKKEFHNCCSNPRCTGYEGTEDEIICPKCKSYLHKPLKS